MGKSVFLLTLRERRRVSPYSPPCATSYKASAHKCQVIVYALQEWQESGQGSPDTDFVLIKVSVEQVVFYEASCLKIPNVLILKFYFEMIFIQMRKNCETWGMIVDTQKMKLWAYLILLCFTDVAVFFTNWRQDKKITIPFIVILALLRWYKARGSLLGIRKLSFLRGESVRVTSQCTSSFKWTGS